LTFYLFPTFNSLVPQNSSKCMSIFHIVFCKCFTQVNEYSKTLRMVKECNNVYRWWYISNPVQLWSSSCYTFITWAVSTFSNFTTSVPWFINKTEQVILVFLKFSLVVVEIAPSVWWHLWCRSIAVRVRCICCVWLEVVLLMRVARIWSNKGLSIWIVWVVGIISVSVIVEYLRGSAVSIGHITTEIKIIDMW